MNPDLTGKFLYQPFSDSLVTQGFSENLVDAYKKLKLAGHPAIDYGESYGADGFNAANRAYCFSIRNKDNPDPSLYRAVYTIVENEYGVFEIVYGHCAAIFAQVGRTYDAGDILYTVGNTGKVYSGGKEVTANERRQGSKKGAHCHFQVRRLEKIKIKTGRKLLEDGSGVFKKDGYYYEIVDYDNGHNGCIDPRPLMLPFLAKDKKKVVSAYQAMLNELLLRLQAAINRRVANI